MRKAHQRRQQDMALMAGGARQRLDGLRNSGSLSQEQWEKKVRELDKLVNAALQVRDRSILMHLV
jgi:hypothetical protein